jgi:hypothetical protein
MKNNNLADKLTLGQSLGRQEVISDMLGDGRTYEEACNIVGELPNEIYFDLATINNFEKAYEVASEVTPENIAQVYARADVNQITNVYQEWVNSLTPDNTVVSDNLYFQRYFFIRKIATFFCVGREISSQDEYKPLNEQDLSYEKYFLTLNNVNNNPSYSTDFKSCFTMAISTLFLEMARIVTPKSIQPIMTYWFEQIANKELENGDQSIPDFITKCTECGLPDGFTAYLLAITGKFSPEKILALFENIN